MKKVFGKLKRFLPSKRRLIQLYAALLFNANLKGFVTKNPNMSIYSGGVKNICTPGLNCYSCPGASGACPLGSLQNALASSGKTVPFYIFGIIILYGIIFGRLICGFLCPFGLIQDLLHKIPTPKLKKNKFTKVLSYLKYVILVFFVFVLPLVYMVKDFPLPAFCKYICPAGTFGGAIALLINPTNDALFARLNYLFTWKFALLVAFFVGCVFIYRMFCRFICPLGALYGLFNRFSILGIKLDRHSCTECGKCIKKCKLDISRVGDHECINCGECVSECPTGAIRWRGGKIFLPKNEIPEGASPEEKALIEKKGKKKSLIIRIVAAVLALSLLGGALVYYNVIDKDEPIEELPTATKMPDFEFKCINHQVENNQMQTRTLYEIDSVVTLAFIDPKEDGASEYLKTLVALAGNVLPTAESELWCTVIVVFKNAPMNDIQSFLTANQSTLEPQYASNAFILTTDESGYSEKVLALDKGDGTYMISKSKNLSSVIEKDANVDELSKRAFIANTDAKEGVKEGNLCPTYDLEYLSVSGTGTLNIEDLRGKVVVLNFWFTDCGPCVEELPEFAEVATEYKDKDVVVIAVHSNDTAYKATDKFFADSGWSDWDIKFVKDGKGEAYYLGKLQFERAWPSTLVIDARGVIHKRFTKKISKAELSSAVEDALAVSKNP